MRVRQGSEHDLPAVMEIVRRAVPLMRASGNLQWDESYPNLTVFREDLDLARLWLAELDGMIAGAVAITTDQEPEYADVGWNTAEPAIVLHRLVVDPAVRGRGVAQALVLHAETVARHLAIGVLRVDTNTQNTATQSLFPRLGYAYAGEISLRLRPGLHFRCYEKRLP